jgi:hypothetical protein
MIFMLHVPSVEGLLIVMVVVVFALLVVSVLVVALSHCSSRPICMDCFSVGRRFGDSRAGLSSRDFRLSIQTPG